MAGTCELAVREVDLLETLELLNKRLGHPMPMVSCLATPSHGGCLKCVDSRAAVKYQAAADGPGRPEDGPTPKAGASP